MQFTLPPAAVAKFYSHSPVNNTEQELRIVAIDIDPKTGLVFDENSQQLTGEPLLLGQHTVTIYYQLVIDSQLSTIKNCQAMLVINPDPRSLWKNIPSDATQLYAKLDAASHTLQNTQIKILAASQRGRSHAHKGDAREDDFFIAQGKDWHLAIVADGAGSAKYSRYGSALICFTIGEFITTALQNSLDVDLKALIKNALAQSWQVLQNQAKQQQHQVKDYASTVLLVLYYFDANTQEYVTASIAIGDGAIALYQPKTGQVHLLNTPDTGSYAGETRFLSDEVLEHLAVNNYRSTEFIPCLLMTDGVSDAFFESDNALKSPQAWHDLWNNLHNNNALDNERNLLAWLDFWSVGNHDDRTLVAILDNNHG